MIIDRQYTYTFQTNDEPELVYHLKIKFGKDLDPKLLDSYKHWCKENINGIYDI